LIFHERKTVISLAAIFKRESQMTVLVQPTKKKSRTMSQYLSYIHNLRGIAIIYVVGVHARGGSADWIAHPQLNQFFSSLLDSQEGNGTVMFLFIAGFLFHHLSQHTFDYGRYLSQKFKLIILPYIIISIPVIMYRIADGYQSLALPPDFDSRSPAYQFLYYLVSGTHMAPFWFISAIILFYFATPVFHALNKDWFFRYVFPVVFILGFFTFRSENNANPLISFVHYVPVYLLGMFVSRNRQQMLRYHLLGFWGLLLLYAGLTAIDLMGLIQIPYRLAFEDVIRNGSWIFNFYLLRSIVLCLLFVFILYRMQHHKLTTVELLGQYSFGIFFIHFILITISRKALLAAEIPVDFNLITFLSYFVFIAFMSTLVVLQESIADI
jgi:peptidoglycan/LPS O-acetylase OafA/YrhL